MASAVDFDLAYALPGDIRVVQRDGAVVQLGTEHPRRLLLVDAPPGTAELLGALDGGAPAGDVVARFGADPLVWRNLLGSMLTAGLLVPPDGRGHPEPHLRGELLALTHRHGQVTADRLLRARADALVVVDGTGTVAGAVAALLASAGVGHVHQHDAPRSAAATRGATAARVGPEGAVQAPAWQAAPGVRVHRPAPQLPPSAVVLAAETLPDLARAAELMAARIPHLAVRVTQARIVVGPLVLPGRSACLGCMERAREDADPGWPAVARRLRDEPVLPAALPAQAAAELAAGQVLELLDGLGQPEAVDGTLERPVHALAVRRRSWQRHPECGCRLLAG